MVRGLSRWMLALGSCHTSLQTRVLLCIDALLGVKRNLLWSLFLSNAVGRFTHLNIAQCIGRKPCSHGARGKWAIGIPTRIILLCLRASCSVAREKQSACMWRPCVEAMGTNLDCAGKEENVDVCNNSESIGHFECFAGPHLARCGLLARLIYCLFQAEQRVKMCPYSFF